MDATKKVGQQLRTPLIRMWHKVLLSGGAARFIAIVLFPFVVIALYLAFFASDRYISEARFTIRDSSASVDMPSFDIGSILSGGGAANQDAYIISEYIISHDLLSRVDEIMNLRGEWSDANVDFVWRLSPEASDEEFLGYYRDMVFVSFNADTSIITAEVQSFSPEVAKNLLEMILADSEQLVNDISNRLAKDQINFINGEIEDNLTRLKSAKAKILEFQNEHKVVNPEVETKLITNVIAQMESGLASDRAQLSALQGYLDRNAPEIISLRNVIAAKVRQIDAEKRRLTGGGDTRLNSIMAQYEELAFVVEFASQRYQSALLALETAQIDASKKVKSLVVISQPNMPDEAIRPERAYLLASVGAFLLMGFGILSVILAALREHLV